jgi:toxin CptA
VISNKENTPFLAELKPSKKLQRLIILIYAIALAASFANALPLVVKAVVVLGIVLHFKLTFPKFNLEQRKLRYSEKRGWELSDGGDFTQVEILKSTVLTTFIIFLHLRDKPAIVIANDALRESDYRQLLVKLKMTAY